MQPNTLSNAELISDLKALVRKENELCLQVIEHLKELDKRKLYRDLGFSSLFAYCTQELGYSEAGAYRRISAARCSEKHPEVLPMLKAKELNLSTLAVIAPILSDANKAEILQASKDKPKVYVEKLASSFKPELPKKDKIRFITNQGSPADLLFASIKQRNENHFRCESKKLEVTFQAEEEFLNKLNQAKVLLSNKYPKGASLEQVFSEALEEFLNQRCPKRRAERRQKRQALKLKAGLLENRKTEQQNHSRQASKTTPEKIKPALRDEVFMRDGFQCRFVGPGGRRCECRKNLEIDHIVPRTRGGANEPGNLRLLCSAHNKLMAERHLGKEFMEIQLRKKRFVG